MQTLHNLWKLVNVASGVRDLTQENKTYQFAVQAGVTFYLHAEAAELRIARWSQPLVRVQTVLRAGFGWRIATEQDEAGVYMVAKRRSLVGGMAAGRFEISVPQDTHLTLKLEGCTLQLNDLHGTYDLAPPQRP